MSTIQGREWYTTEYLVSPHWKNTSRKKLKKYPLCQACHKKPSRDVHHKHYRTLWHEDIDKDLEALDRNCHYKKRHTGKWLLSLRPSNVFNPLVQFLFNL